MLFFFRFASLLCLCAVLHNKQRRIGREEGTKKRSGAGNTHTYRDSPGTVDIEIYLHNSGFSVCGFSFASFISIFSVTIC